MNSIAVVIESMGGGGSQHVVASLLQHWCKNGRETHLITFQSVVADRFSVPSQVRRHFVKSPAVSTSLLARLINNWHRMTTLRSAIRDSGASVILSFVTETNVLTILATLGLGCRIVVSERNDPRRQSLPYAWRFLRYLSYPLADLVTANSHMATHALSEMLALRHVSWLPNPLRQPLSDHVAEKKGPVLLAVGRLHPQKDYETLLEAFFIAQPLMCDWTLRILGGGQLEHELRDLSLRLGIADKVEFLGHIADPFPHYRAADLFVMTSRHEGSPNALWEAMSCGIATIVADSIEGALEVVSGGQSTYVVPVGNPDALATALKELAGNPDLRRQLGREALLAVRQFAADDVFDIWDRLLFSKSECHAR